MVLGTALLVNGHPDDAIRTVSSRAKDDYNRLVLEAAAYAVRDRAASDRALAALVQKYDSTSQYQIAEVHSWRREPDLAFAAIARAWDGLDPGLINLKTDPLLAPIRADARYGEWLHKVGFA